ncbi:hypothetical protein FEM21_25380 [Flavobacterium seoulense]|uniref:Uncharacterized protein n=1 Tax=Flavobacterium seoulense TaxID=1492738 RepID=A0A066WJU7_9FLAO|nr:hypothetical protein FEM21_25380 [Flavobacterium seoulense]
MKKLSRFYTMKTTVFNVNRVLFCSKKGVFKTNLLNLI